MSKKFFVALTLLVAVAVAGSASAVTVAELQAQIAALTAQLATLSGTTATSSSVPTITKSLTLGSRGDEVSALQQYLIDEGLLNVAAPTGYFGAMTKAAVVAWQKANGVTPASGYFGPISRAALAAMGTTSTGTGTTGTGTTGTVVADGTDGSATVSLNSYVGNQTLKKGETKDMYAVELTAAAGKVTISRFDVRLSKRPWLYFSKLTLKDSTGTVIAEKAITGSADATELTVGSDYMVRFDNLNYTLTPGDDKILVVAGTVLSSTDKLSSDVTITVNTGSNGIRTINGKGYTDSLSESTGRTVTLSSSGSTGNILARVSSATPAARIVNTSTSGETTGVVLGAFEFKAENQSSTLNSLVFTLKNSDGQAFSTLFKRLYIDDGSRTWNVSSVATTSTFSDLTIDLAKDTWKTLTLKADVADADDFTNGVMASTTMAVSASTVVGIDANYQTATASGGNTITSNNVTLLQSGASLSGLSKTVSNNPGANGVKGATSTMSFTFTLNNTGSSDLYVSKTPATFLATSTTAFDTSKSMGLTLITSGSTNSTDSTSYYVIPSNTNRTFTVSGTYGNDGGTSAGLKTFTISKVYFDDDTTGLQEFNIDYGLEDWYVQDYQDN